MLATVARRDELQVWVDQALQRRRAGLRLELPDCAQPAGERLTVAHQREDGDAFAAMHAAALHRLDEPRDRRDAQLRVALHALLLANADLLGVAVAGLIRRLHLDAAL